MAKSTILQLLEVIKAVNGVERTWGEDFGGTIIVLVVCPESCQAAVRAAADEFKQRHKQVYDVPLNFKES